MDTFHYYGKDKKQIAAKGENIFNNFLEENGLAKNDLSIVDKILNHFGIDKKEELFYQLGSNNISLDESVKKLFKNKSQNVFMKYLKMPFGGNNKSAPVPVKPESVAAPDRKIDRKATYILRDDGKEKNYTIAPCCCPIPGDDVLGYINEDETVVVHKRSCPIAMKLKSSFGPRLVSTQWDERIDESFPATIEIKGIDGVGVLNHITKVISEDLAINIRNLSIESNDGLFTGKLGIMVHDVQDIEKLCNNIKKVKEVKSAVRVKNI